MRSHACVIGITHSLLLSASKWLTYLVPLPQNAFVVLSCGTSRFLVMIGPSRFTRMTQRHAIHAKHAHSPSSAAGGDARHGRRASGRSPGRLRLLVLSCEENQREVGPLGHVNIVHGLSCGENPGRYDYLEPRDAERADLLCVPREIGGVTAACALREGGMCGLS